MLVKLECVSAYTGPGPRCPTAPHRSLQSLSLHALLRQAASAMSLEFAESSPGHLAQVWRSFAKFKQARCSDSAAFPAKSQLCLTGARRNRCWDSGLSAAFGDPLRRTIASSCSVCPLSAFIYLEESAFLLPLASSQFPILNLLQLSPPCPLQWQVAFDQLDCLRRYWSTKFACSLAARSSRAAERSKEDSSPLRCRRAKEKHWLSVAVACSFKRNVPLCGS